MDKFGHLWKLVEICGHLWTFEDMFGNLWTCLDTCGHLMDNCGRLILHLSAFWTFVEFLGVVVLSGHLFFGHVFGHDWTFVDMLGYLWTSNRELWHYKHL